MPRRIPPVMPDYPSMPYVWHDAEELRQGNRIVPGEAGWFADWQHDDVRAFVAMLRRTITPKPSCQEIAERYSFQNWLRVFHCYRTYERRNGRHTGALRADDSRSWTRRRRVRGRMVTERLFGMEIEFFYSGRNLYAARDSILDDLRTAGITAHDRWGSYGWNAAIGGWQGTYDSTVTGGELVAPPLPCNDAGLAELAVGFAAIRRHGGHTAVNQGLHTNVGVGDFDNDDLARLARNCEALQRHFVAYMPADRRSGTWCRPADSYTMDVLARTLSQGGQPYDDHHTLFNFGNATAHTATDKRRVEFRGLGQTLNMGKVRPWVRVCVAVVTASKAGVVFDTNQSLSESLAVLRQHGLTAWSADAFQARCQRRQRVAA